MEIVLGLSYAAVYVFMVWDASVCHLVLCRLVA